MRGRVRRERRAPAYCQVMDWAAHIALWVALWACYNRLNSFRKLRELSLAFQRMRDYELVMIISPEADEEETAATIERVAGLITGHGGSISEQETWGLRRLAYPIQRFQEGNYVLTRFALEAEHVLELGRGLNASQNVLRHLVTKTSESR